MITIKQVANFLRNEKGMDCNCDLDNWEPERDTGHSKVCRIHRAAKSASPQFRDEIASTLYRSHESDLSASPAPDSDKPDRTGKYFYRIDKCEAKHADNDDCMCWHLYGTGPLPTKVAPDSEGDSV